MKMKKPVEVWRWKRYPENSVVKCTYILPLPRAGEGCMMAKTQQTTVYSPTTGLDLDLKGIEPLAFRTRVTEKSCHAKRTLYH